MFVSRSKDSSLPDLDAFDGQDHSGDVVIYRAIVSITGVEWSSLWFDPEFSEGAFTEILLRPAPHYIHFPWPPVRSDGELERRNEVLGMLRLKAGLDIGSGISPMASSAEIEESMLALHPLLGPLRQTEQRENYIRRRLCANIDREGGHCFSISTESIGLPWPLTEEVTRTATSRGALTKYLQCMGRIDLLERLKQLN